MPFFAGQQTHFCSLLTIIVLSCPEMLGGPRTMRVSQSDREHEESSAGLILALSSFKAFGACRRTGRLVAEIFLRKICDALTREGILQ